MNVDRVAATGTLVTFQSIPAASEVNDNISNNNITFTSLPAQPACTGHSSLGGQWVSETISGNTISIRGLHTGASIGITSAFIPLLALFKPTPLPSVALQGGNRVLPLAIDRHLHQ